MKKVLEANKRGCVKVYYIGDSLVKNLHSFSTVNPTKEEQPVNWVWRSGAKTDQVLKMLESCVKTNKNSEEDCIFVISTFQNQLKEKGEQALSESLVNRTIDIAVKIVGKYNLNNHTNHSVVFTNMHYPTEFESLTSEIDKCNEVIDGKNSERGFNPFQIWKTLAQYRGKGKGKYFPKNRFAEDGYHPAEKYEEKIATYIRRHVQRGLHMKEEEVNDKTIDIQVIEESDGDEEELGEGRRVNFVEKLGPMPEKIVQSDN